MTPEVVALVGIGVLFVFLAIGIPVGFALFIVGFGGVLYLGGINAGWGALGVLPWNRVAHYTLTAVPLFILMGHFAFHSGLSRDLYEFAYKWIGRRRGGLGIATIVACGMFAAASGSSLATAAAMGTVALPEMRRYGYDRKLAAGVVAAGGTLGILIPPSIILIIYGITVEESIGKLLLAGFLPGVMLVILLSLTLFIIVSLRPALAPIAPGVVRWKEKLVSLRGVWAVLVLFTLVMGSIYTGIATATEAAAIGAFGAFIIALAKRGITWRNLRETLTDTARTCGMVFLIIVGATAFGVFLALSQLPFMLSEWVVGLVVSRYVVLGLTLLSFLFLGCIMDALAMLLLTLPIIYPIVMALGFDPIWFGVVCVLMFEVALITPPVGMNVFVIRGVAKDIPLEDIFIGIVPFFITLLVGVVILVAFPQIALLLPGMMMK